ncbi:MAG: hypothetical protein OXH65_03160 [Paracoccaceae bacterium]|nr:hypothetical protein [Paracoccaceae bacterium]
MLLKDWEQENIPVDWDTTIIGTDDQEEQFLVIFESPNQVRAYVVCIKPVRALDGKIHNTVKWVVDGNYTILEGEVI